MSAAKTREQRIDELLDKQALTELIHAYANAADRHDHDKMRALYHPDAIDDHGHFFKGPAMDFIDLLPEIQQGMAILHHNITTVNLKLDGEWKFSHRAIVADWAWPMDPTAIQMDHPFLSGAHIGCPGTKDPSYAFFTMFQRGSR